MKSIDEHYSQTSMENVFENSDAHQYMYDGENSSQIKGQVLNLYSSLPL